METFTAFVQANDGNGTTWIEAVEAPNVDVARAIALDTCAAAWECEAGDLRLLGIAAGDVRILEWNDDN